MSVTEGRRGKNGGGAVCSRRELLGGVGAAWAAGSLSGLTLRAQSAEESLSRPSAVTAVYGHRGALMYAPENTLPALELCLIAGCGFEIDFRELKDGEIIALHDDTFNRTTDTAAPNDAPRKRTLAEVKQLDAGSWFHPDFAGTRVPTLCEVCTLIREKARGNGVVMLVDVKVMSDNFLRRIKSAFDGPNPLFPRVRFRVDTAAQAERLKSCDSRFVCVKSGKERELVKEVSDSPLYEGAWTGNPTAIPHLRAAGKTSYLTLFNRPEAMLRLKAAGATAVITNYPLVLKRIACPPPPDRDWNAYMKSEEEKDAYRFSGKI